MLALSAALFSEAYAALRESAEQVQLDCKTVLETFQPSVRCSMR
jgi:hypothetical protein